MTDRDDFPAADDQVVTPSRTTSTEDLTSASSEESAGVVDTTEQKFTPADVEPDRDSSDDVTISHTSCETEQTVPKALVDAALAETPIFCIRCRDSFPASSFKFADSNRVVA